MSDVKLKLSSSLSSLESYNNYTLNGNLIRYVHIPRSIDIKESVKVYIITIIIIISLIHTTNKLFSMSTQQKKVGNLTRVLDIITYQLLLEY